MAAESDAEHSYSIAAGEQEKDVKTQQKDADVQKTGDDVQSELCEGSTRQMVVTR